MSNVARPCPQCGQPVAANLMGLCPQCMLKAGMMTASVGPGGEKGEKFVPPTVEELGRYFPMLEILELIGRGGMGAVYKARQRELGRVVALKILPADVAKDAAFAERFTREAKALAALSHPHIVTLYEYGKADGLYYFLMEYVEGANLRHVMAGGRMEPKQALAVVPQICEALQYAHERGIVHRDIKPENVLLSREGVVKIADFGVAKIVGRSGEATQRKSDEGVVATDAWAVGTPAYMAPEQKERPAEVDHRADIYSLGVVLYQMLTGELPGKDALAPSRRVQVDVRLDEVVLKAMEREPERRYETAGVMKTAVETIAGDDTAGRGTVEDDWRVPLAYGVESKLSRTASLAAIWLGLSLVVIVPFVAHEYETHEFGTHGPLASPLAAAISFGIVLPAMLAPLGVTILGWIAVERIRRSGGGLHGMWLAVFDGLAYPLLLLDVLIAAAWYPLFFILLEPQRADLGAIGVWGMLFGIWACVSVVTSLVVDALVVRWVWRKVSGHQRGVPPAVGSAASAKRIPVLDQVLLVFLGMVLMACLSIVVWRIAFHVPPAGQPAVAPESSVRTPNEGPQAAPLGNDDVNRPFVNDSAAIGYWQTVDYVRSAASFDPAKRAWPDDFFVRELQILPDGRTDRPWRTWTKGYLIHRDPPTACRYDILDIGGATYLFYEWRNDDVVLRGATPWWYVLKKVGPAPTTNATKTELEERLRQAAQTTILADGPVQPGQVAEYYMGGKLQRVGVYSLVGDHPITMKQAIVSAGLPATGDLSRYRVVLVRRTEKGGEYTTTISLGELMTGRTPDRYLQSDDVIQVEDLPAPTTLPAIVPADSPVPFAKSAEYTVDGKGVRGGRYSLTGRAITVKQALVSAGLDPDGPAHIVVLLRRDGTQSRTRATVRIGELFAGRAADYYLQDGDRLLVDSPTTLPAGR